LRFGALSGLARGSTNDLHDAPPTRPQEPKRAKTAFLAPLVFSRTKKSAYIDASSRGKK
jgi:hypothetical protein